MLLLDLLNELGKSDIMRSLLSIVSLFRNEFNKYNDTGTRMFDFIYVKSFEFVLKSHFRGDKSCYRRHHNTLYVYH